MPAEMLWMRQIRGVLRQRFVSELPQRALSQGAVSGYLSLARGAGVSWPLLEDLDDEQLEALVLNVFSRSPSSLPGVIAAICKTVSARKGCSHRLHRLHMSYVSSAATWRNTCSGRQV
jgi:hypothetical protein